MLFWAVLAIPVPALVGAGPEYTEDQAGILIYESPVFVGDGEAYRPMQEMEQDSRQYRLVTSELQKVVQTGRNRFVSSQISFALEGDWDPPETAEITVKDDETGIVKEYTVPRMKMEEKSREWSDDFSFSVTVTGYGSESFWLGVTEIPGDVPLIRYGPEVLRYLNLPEDCYQVEEVVWSGEVYEKEGILCRDAQARGRKLIRNMEVLYGGQVELPPVEGMKYYCVYQEKKEEQKEGMEEETANQIGNNREELTEPGQQEEGTEIQNNMDYSETQLDKILRWFTEHLTVVRIGAVFFAGILLAVLLLILTGKKKGENHSDTDIE